MLLAHAFRKVDNYATIKEIASTWQDGKNIEDTQILEFEMLLKERVGSQLVENRKLFFESLNERGLGYFIWALHISSTYPSITMDDSIAMRVKAIARIEECGLENEED